MPWRGCSALHEQILEQPEDVHRVAAWAQQRAVGQLLGNWAQSEAGTLVLRLEVASNRDQPCLMLRAIRGGGKGFSQPRVRN